jgi:hypothetical protein
VTFSPEPVDPRRRVRPSTVVVGLLVLALVTVSTGWWWTSRAQAAVANVHLVPGSLACHGERAPYVVEGPDSDGTDLPAFELDYVRDRACVLTLRVRNDGDRGVHVHHLSAPWLAKDTSFKYEPDPSAEGLYTSPRDGRIEVDEPLGPSESLDVTVAIRANPRTCLSSAGRAWTGLGSIDVSSWGHHVEVSSEGFLAAVVTSDVVDCP